MKPSGLNEGNPSPQLLPHNEQQQQQEADLVGIKGFHQLLATIDTF